MSFDPEFKFEYEMTSFDGTKWHTTTSKNSFPPLIRTMNEKREALKLLKEDLLPENLSSHPAYQKIFRGYRID